MTYYLAKLDDDGLAVGEAIRPPTPSWSVIIRVIWPREGKWPETWRATKILAAFDTPEAAIAVAKSAESAWAQHAPAVKAATAALTEAKRARTQAYRSALAAGITSLGSTNR